VEEDVDPSDHDQNQHNNSAQGADHEPTHANAGPPEGDGWLRSVLENSTEVAKVVDPDGTLRYASPAFEWILGYDPVEAAGTMNVLDHVHPDDLPLVLAESEKALAEGKATSNRAEYRFRHKDGSWRWMESVGTYLLDDPAVGGVVVVSRDVTERKEAQERYRTLVEKVPPIIYIERPREGETVTYDTTYISPRVEEVLGYPPQSFTGDPGFWNKVIHPEDLQAVWEENQRTDQTGEPFCMEYRVIANDGRTVWIRDEATLARDEEGEPLYWLGVQTDVTERRLTEARLGEAEARYRSLVEQVPVAIYRQEIDHDGAISYISPQIEAITGYAPEEYEDPTFWVRTMHPDDRQRVLDEDERTDQTGEPYRVEFRKFARDRRLIWLRDEAVLVRDETGGPLYWQGVVQDVTERKTLEERLEHQALHDPLTGLPNRTLFVDRLGQALARTQRRRSGSGVAVLFMDLDGFKAVNDSLGHNAGDRLLVAVAERLKGCFRPEDTLARFAGDEFIVLLEEVNGADDALRVAQRIIEEFQGPFALEGREIFVRFSIGVALGEAHTKDPEGLLRDADIAMYRAKEDAADYRVFNPEMHQQALGRLELENDLRHALENEELRVYYQPKVRLGQPDGIEGVEALVRWVHPENGFMLPDEFIPLAEETGLIIPLDIWVMQEACRQVKEWQEHYPNEPPLAICVNLSARQVRHPGLRNDVRSVLRESGLEPGSLILEITEGTLLKDTQLIQTIFRELKALGVRLEIDDFGKEYSSLSYLTRLPVDALKIDRSFLESFGENPSNTIIVEAVVSLAHSLGLEVTGEGVESAGQLELLRGMGCDFAQGYHLARPLPREEVEQLLVNRTTF